MPKPMPEFFESGPNVNRAHRNIKKRSQTYTGNVRNICQSLINSLSRTPFSFHKSGSRKISEPRCLRKFLMGSRSDTYSIQIDEPTDPRICRGLGERMEPCMEGWQVRWMRVRGASKAWYVDRLENRRVDIRCGHIQYRLVRSTPPCPRPLRPVILTPCRPNDSSS